MKAILIYGFFSVLILGLTQCRQENKTTQQSDISKPLQAFTYQQAMMGTRFFITLYAEEKSHSEKAAKAAFQYATNVNAACSDYDVTSELMKLNAAPANTPIPLSDILYDVLKTSLQIAESTQGAYDPTLGHHSYNWRMARKKNALPPDEKISAALAASGWKNLQIDHSKKSITKLLPNIRLDLGGIAKGYAADGMLKILNEHAITRASITAGGEVRLGDPPPTQEGWRITLKTLDANHRLSPFSVLLSNCAISTSGDLHQSVLINGKRYSHIVDPSTGLGLTKRISATVIGPSCTITDALATALCVAPNTRKPNYKTLVIYQQKDGALKAIQSTQWK